MTAKPRPGGRSARNKAAVFEAAAALLAERGHESISMTDIAERAGMASTSLYRRWGDVRALMMEVAVEKLMRERRRPIPDAARRPARLGPPDRGQPRKTRRHLILSGGDRNNAAGRCQWIIAPRGAETPERADGADAGARPAARRESA